jgi:hypothetical protein
LRIRGGLALRSAAAGVITCSLKLVAAERAHAQASYGFFRYADGSGFVSAASQPYRAPATRRVELVRHGTVVAGSAAFQSSGVGLPVGSLLGGDVVRLVEGTTVVTALAYDGLPAINADACAPSLQFTATVSPGSRTYRAGAYGAGQDYFNANPATWTDGSPTTVRLRQPMTLGGTAFVATTGHAAADPSVSVTSESRATIAACPVPPPEPAVIPPPKFGKRATARVLSGRVLIRRPGGKTELLDGAASIPVGSIVDTRAGTVEIAVATPKGKTEKVKAHSGTFKLVQRRQGGYLTELTLRGGSFKGCPTPRHASAASGGKSKKKKPRRQLWTDGKGRFRSGGHYGNATVRGTQWETIDRCDGTLVRVRKGAVVVRDFARRRNVLVRAGHSYLARARRG